MGTALLKTAIALPKITIARQETAIARIKITTAPLQIDIARIKTTIAQHKIATALFSRRKYFEPCAYDSVNRSCIAPGPIRGYPLRNITMVAP